MLSTSNGQYKQQSLKDYLIGRIRSGEYPSGVQAASEPELCKKFNLSRNITRQALQELELEGYVYRIRGKVPDKQPLIEPELIIRSSSQL